MSGIPLEVIKRHCQADDFDDDDALLAELQVNAEGYVAGYVRRDLDTEFPDGWPEKDFGGSVKMLVAFWYENRSGTDAGAGWDNVRKAVGDMLAPMRDLS